MTPRRRLPLPLLLVTAATIAAVAIGLVMRSTTRTSSSSSTARQVSFQGEVIAVVDEGFGDPPPRSVQRLVRTTSLLSLNESTRLTVDLDDEGQALTAHYERTGQRVVELTRDGTLIVDGRIAGRLAPPVVVLDVLHRVRLTSAKRVTLFEPASAEFQPATIVRRGPHVVALDGDHDGDVIARALPEGPRLGPGAFAEGDAPPVRPWPTVELEVPGRTTVRGARLKTGVRRRDPLAPPTDSDRRPGPFIESDAPELLAFARPLCRADPLETARAVGEAVRSRVDASARGVAPGALNMLRRGGDCDGAAALATAALRACGHAARIVSGYRLVEPGPVARLVPHALAEVYPGGPDGDDARVWWRLDATVPTLLDIDDRFLAVADGPGGALTMGRVLGVVDATDLEDAIEAHVPPPVEPDARP